MKKHRKNSKGKKRGIAHAISYMPTSQKIAVGAAGVAMAASTIAAGAVLADKKTRVKLGIQAKKAIRTIQDVAKELNREELIARSTSPRKRLR